MELRDDSMSVYKPVTLRDTLAMCSNGSALTSEKAIAMFERVGEIVE